MDQSRIANLLVETYSEDAYGVLIPAISSRPVYCNVTSVSGREWYDGSRIGINPEYRVIMFAYDYNGEELIELDGVVYTIYRTFKGRNDTIELYLSKRQGNTDLAPAEG